VIRPSRRDVSDTVASDDVGEFISESAAGMRGCAAAAGLRWRSVSFRLVRGGRRAVSLLTRVGVRNKTTRTSNEPACTSSGHIGGPATLDISSGQNSLTRIARRPSPQRLRMRRSARPWIPTVAHSQLMSEPGLRRIHGHKDLTPLLPVMWKSGFPTAATRTNRAKHVIAQLR
jgi:hypothetical protein